MIQKITTEHKITFQVKAFWNEEGGMGEEEFGPVVNDLPDAVQNLMLAKISKPKEPWIIVAEVITSVKAQT